MNSIKENADRLAAARGRGDCGPGRARRRVCISGPTRRRSIRRLRNGNSGVAVSDGMHNFEHTT